VVLEPTYVTEKRSICSTSYKDEERSRVVSGYKMVPVTEERIRLTTVSTPRTETKTIEYTNALDDFNQALALAPDYALCHQNRAWLLATSPEDSLRDGQAALASALRACELNQYRDPSDLKALAASYAETGQFDIAIGWQEKVIGLSAPDEKGDERKVLEQYQDKQPYRDR
jgi:tetratricopeptide (TPR) repeat protein